VVGTTTRLYDYQIKTFHSYDLLWMSFSDYAKASRGAEVNISHIKLMSLNRLQ
jgi:hypothetical protein